jgi:hypothetical protein
LNGIALISTLLRRTLSNNKNFGTFILVVIGESALAALHLTIDRAVLGSKVNFTHTNFALK